eukprot:1176340-Prorocentrum_minimum.AAC.3
MSTSSASCPIKRPLVRIYPPDRPCAGQSERSGPLAPAPPANRRALPLAVPPFSHHYNKPRSQLSGQVSGLSLLVTFRGARTALSRRCFRSISWVSSSSSSSGPGADQQRKGKGHIPTVRTNSVRGRGIYLRCGPTA